MKKLFSFFAAMLVAVAVNADPVAPGANALSAAISAAEAGSVIELATGDFTESSSFSIKKDLTIKAADGASPVIKQAADAYFSIKNNAKVLFKGLKFDGDNTATYGFYANDAANRAIEIRFDDCEFTGYKKHIITSTTTTHADSLIVNNCYFHDNIARACIYFPAATDEGKQTIKGVKVLNSTFANNDANGDWVGVIDIRSNSSELVDSIEVLVDHCTFYKNITKNYDYADVKVLKSSKVTVSNCIFYGPSSTYDGRATHLYSGVVKNCLTINYVHDKAGHRADGALFQDTLLNRDPLFQDVANEDFTLSYGSPALTAATDGGAIGDPRWATKFYITGNFTGEGAKDWQAHDRAAVKSYTFKNLAAGDYQFKITRNGTWTGDDNVYGYDALTSKIGGLYRWNGGESDNNIMFTLADAGDVTITYVHGEKFTVEGDFTIWPVKMVGTMCESWTEEAAKAFTPAPDKLTASLKLNLTNDYYEFKIIDNTTWKGKWINNEKDKYYLTRKVLTVNNLEYGKNNLVITPDVATDYTFTWTYGTGELSVTFPPLPAPVYYLAGSMFTDGDWDKALVAMTEKDGIWSKTVNIENVDTKAFKIVSSVEGIHIISQDWLGLGGAQTITATTKDLVLSAEGKEAIGITLSKTGDYVFAFDPDGNKVSVTYPDGGGATALDNTEAASKAVKSIENGMLIIEKNGVRYNAQGQIVR